MIRAIYILILGASLLCAMAQPTYTQTPWQMRVFTNVADLVANGSPKNVNKAAITFGDGVPAIYVATNIVTGTNTTTRIYSGTTGWSWDKVGEVALIWKVTAGVIEPVISTNALVLGNTTVSGNITNSVLLPFSVVSADANKAMMSITNGTSGQVLTANGASSFPTFQAVTNVSGFTNIALLPNINPTDYRLPARSNGTTFGDSPFSVHPSDTNFVGFNSTNRFLTALKDNIGNEGAHIGLGYNALKSYANGTFGGAVAIGNDALENATGINNIGIGQGAGNKTVTGLANVFIGTRAGFSNISSSRILNAGYNAGGNNLANDMVALGFQAGLTASNGTRAVIIGSQPWGSERTDKTFTDTLWIGYKGSTVTNNTQTITNSVLIGNGLSPDASNEIVIGQGATQFGANTVNLGNNNATDIYLPNSIHLDRSATNVIYRSGSDMVYTNTSVSTNGYVVASGFWSGGVPDSSGFGIKTETSGGTALTFKSTSVGRVGALFGSGLYLPAGSTFGFTSGDPYTTAAIAKLQNEGTGVVGLNNGTTAQILRIYSTTNSGTGDYERLAISPTAASDGVTYNTQAGGAGVFRAHTFQVGGTNMVQIDSNTTTDETGLLVRANGSVSRVKVGAAGTGPGGSGRALYID